MEYIEMGKRARKKKEMGSEHDLQWSLSLNKATKSSERTNVRIKKKTNYLDFNLREICHKLKSFILMLYQTRFSPAS